MPSIPGLPFAVPPSAPILDLRRRLDACPKGLQEKSHGRLRLIFDAPDLVTPRRLKDEVVHEYAVRAPKAVERLETGLVERLIGAVLIEIDEAWTTEHRYFDMAEYWEWRKSAASQDVEATLGEVA